MEKTIKVDIEDWEELQRQKINLRLNKIAEVVKSNITFCKKFNNEKEFCSWIRKNYNLLGFDEIIKENKGGSSPDFIFRIDSKELRVEVETLSSHFILHKHNPKDFDMVLCLVEDKKIPLKTIELMKFEYLNPNGLKTTIQISDKLKKFLNENGKRGETYEDIIWKLIKENENKK